tara:strand:- start:137 stop:298 length:162 start_codon:yes stop_codon:yes gene_type:complete
LPAVLQKTVLYSNNGQVATKLHKLDEIMSSLVSAFDKEQECDDKNLRKGKELQ